MGGQPAVNVLVRGRGTVLGTHRLLSFVDAMELERLRTRAEAELTEPKRWDTTFTLLQAWGRVA